MMKKNNELMERIFKEPVFLENHFEEMAIRIPPGKEAPNWGKFPGLPEFQVEPGAAVVLDAIREAKEISETDYENY